MDAAWLERHGYYGQLRSRYVEHGWLTQPTRRVYCRPRGDFKWEQVVISLQGLLELPVVVGGRTALESQGYAHFLPRQDREVHLYGRRSPPAWLQELPLSVRFVFHQSRRLFTNDPPTRGVTSLDPQPNAIEGEDTRQLEADLTIQRWGHWSWPLALSTPERSLLELLDELPDRESFHHWSCAHWEPNQVDRDTRVEVERVLDIVAFLDVEPRGCMREE